MQHQPALIVYLGKEILAVTPGRFQAAARQSPLQRARGDILQNLLSLHLDALNGLVQRGRIQVLFKNLNVGKFRHESFAN